MKIIYNRIILVKGFSAINLCGGVFARKECRPLSYITISNKAIHPARQKEWFYAGLDYIRQFLRSANQIHSLSPRLSKLFFILYSFEWIFKGYRGISFDKEADRYQGLEGYLKRRKHVQNYIR